MRVIIDVSPAVYHRAGIGRYVQELTEALLIGAPDHHLTAFYNHPYDASPAVDPVMMTLGRCTVPWSDRSWRARVLLAYLLDRDQGALVGDSDVFHATDHLLPHLKNTAGVFTLHDLSFLTTRTHRTLNEIFLRLSMSRFLGHARAVIVPSEATKRDAQRLYGLPPDRLHVVPHGVNSRFFQVEQETVQDMRLRYGLPDTFILAVGTIEPRKNLSRLLDATRQLHAQGLTAPLVLAGRMGWRDRSIRRRLEAAELEKIVRLLGFVGDKDLPALYAAATVFAYPSLYEGFGLPVLEAMAAGTAVVSSNAASLPEVVGDAGVLVSPYDIEELAAAIKSIVSQPDLRTVYQAAGRERAQQFTWARTARLTTRVYESTIGHWL